MNDEELMLSKRMLELGNLCYQRSIPYTSDFLNLNEQNILNQVITKMPPICVKTVGGYNLAERKIAAFCPDENTTPVNPIICLAIEPLSKKFSEDLTHRDYLGALINLGIERSVIGDIVIGKNYTAYVFCLKKIKDFIISELTRIKHTTVNVYETEFEEESHINYEEITGFVASLRIDAILSLTTKMSRSKAISYIEDAKVFINGKLITTNSYNLKENDIISVRGIGKFKLSSIGGTSKKGRLFLTVLKYC